LNTSRWNQVKTPLLVIGLTLGISAACLGYGHRRFGSFEATIDFVRGQRLLVDSQSRAFGEVPTSSEFKLRYLMTNMTGRPVRLVGSRSSCTCSMVDQSASVLPNGESREIVVQVTAPDQPREVSGVIEVVTDDPEFLRFPLSFQGRAVLSQISEAK